MSTERKDKTEEFPTSQSANVSEEAVRRDDSESNARAVLIRAIKIALIVIGVLLAGVAVTSIFVGGEQTLPFDYDGFD